MKTCLLIVLKDMPGMQTYILNIALMTEGIFSKFLKPYRSLK